MKNCDEMVNSLLERRERYVAEQKRKRKVLTRTVTSMCCVCLVALLGFGMWQSGILTTTPPITPPAALDNPINIGEDYINPDESNNGTNIERTQGNQSDQQTEDNENLFVVNQVDSILAAKMYGQVNSFEKLPYHVWMLVLEDFHKFVGITYEEFTDKIPDSFECYHFYSLSIPRYKDANLADEYRLHDYVFAYQTGKGGGARIAICSFEEPLRDYFIMCDNPKQSEINGVPVVIYGYQDTFMVQFSHENINYDIETSNITLEELEDLLIGIIE